MNLIRFIMVFTMMVVGGGGLALADSLSYDADVSIWDSSVPSDPVNGVFPIGGSGQVNGNFVVATFDVDGRTILELGVRYSRRFSGLSLNNLNELYFIEPGESSPGLTNWNLDFHVNIMEGLEFDDFSSVKLWTSWAGDIELKGFLPGNTRFLQGSENPNFAVFGGGGLVDPFAEGFYSFGVTLTQQDENTYGVGARLQVGGEPVPEPATLALLSLGGLASLLRARAKRRESSVIG